MRTSVALAVAISAVAVMVLLLMREETQVWHLWVVGAFGGALVGFIRWGRRGAYVGMTVGFALGLVAPLLYAPFWLMFTLPPHPARDL